MHKDTEIARRLYQEKSWIFFDCDGLIFDSESAAFQAWSELYQEYGFELDLKDWILCVGSGPQNAGFSPDQNLKNLIQKKDPSLVPADPDEFFQRKQARKTEICASAPLLPGILELLESIKKDGKKAGVVSSSPKEWVEPHLERLGIAECFEFVVTRSDLGPDQKSKPAPDLYLLGIKAASTPPEQVLVLEDSARGVEAAKAAGASCIAIPNDITRVSSFDHADACLSSAVCILKN